MKKQFFITLGPIDEKHVGATVQLTTAVAPLHEVYWSIKTNAAKNKTPTGITRMTITDEIVKHMKELRAENYDADQIARAIGCSRTSVKRHAPREMQQKKLM